MLEQGEEKVWTRDILNILLDGGHGRYIFCGPGYWGGILTQVEEENYSIDDDEYR